LPLPRDHKGSPCNNQAFSAPILVAVSFSCNSKVS